LRRRGFLKPAGDIFWGKPHPLRGGTGTWIFARVSIWGGAEKTVVGGLKNPGGAPQKGESGPSPKGFKESFAGGAVQCVAGDKYLPGGGYTKLTREEAYDAAPLSDVCHTDRQWYHCVCLQRRPRPDRLVEPTQSGAVYGEL